MSMRRWLIRISAGIAASAVLVGALIGEHMYDQQAQSVALAHLHSHDNTVLTAQHLADAEHETAALTAQRIVIPTAIQGTAVAHETATSVALATRSAGWSATAVAAQTATAISMPGFVHLCKADGYSPTFNTCVKDDYSLTESQANDAHLVLDAVNTVGTDRTITIDVEQTQPDGTLQSVNTVDAKLNGNYGSTWWTLPIVLPTAFSGTVKPGQYQTNVSVNWQDMPIYYVTVYQ